MSHLISKPFVVQELYVSQIRVRIAAECLRGFHPVRYENQYLRGYH